MDDLSINTCALLNAVGERIARGRCEISADGAGVKFAPASIVTPEQMAQAAFLWPDGDDRIPITVARPDTDGHHFVLGILPKA